MANLAQLLRLPSNLKESQLQVLAGPILILMILSMMVLPLPPFVLDLLFTFNIALSIMVLLVANTPFNMWVAFLSFVLIANVLLTHPQFFGIAPYLPKDIEPHHRY